MMQVARAGLLAGAFLCSAAASAADSPIVTIRFGDLGASTGNLYQSLAVEKGIYRHHGIDLEVVPFLQGGPEAVAAAVANQIDMGSVGTPVLIAISRGMPIRIVGSPPRKGQPFILVGRPEVRTVSELRGKVVGFSSVGGGSAEALHVILSANDVTADQVQTIAYGAGPNGYIALKSGRLTGAVLAEPYATRAELDGVGHVLADADAYFAHYQHSYIFATQKFIAGYPEAIRAYFEASREALRYAKVHQDELVAFGQKTLKLDERLLRAVFAKEIPKWDENDDVDTEGLLNALKIVQQIGDIRKSYVPDLDYVIDPRFSH